MKAPAMTALMVSVAYLAVASAWAAESDMLFDLPATMTGTRMPQHAELGTQPVTIIDHQTLRDLNPRRLMDVVRLVPGMTPFSQYGNQQSLAYMGATHASGWRFQVRLDGRSINLPLAGGSYFGNLPVQLKDIERIEVYRGPSSAMYGANAALFTMNIITKTGKDAPGVTISGNVGNNEILDGYASVGGHTDTSSGIASIKHYGDNGLVNREDDRNDNGGWLRLESALTADTGIDASFGASKSLAEAGGTDPALDPVRTLEHNRQFAQATLRHQPSAAQELVVVTYFDQFENYQIKHASLGVVPFTQDYSFDTKNVGGEAYHTYHWDQASLLIGGSAEHQTITSEWRLIPELNGVEQNNVYQGFTEITWDINSNNRVHGGALFEYHDGTKTDDAISPQASYIYHTDNHIIRLSYGRGTIVPPTPLNVGARAIQSPALPYPIYDYLGPGDLVNETLDEYRLTYTYLEGSRFKAELSAYYSELDNYMLNYAYPATDPLMIMLGMPIQISVKNINDAFRYNGIEGLVQWQATDTLRFWVTGAYTDASPPESSESIWWSNTNPEFLVSLFSNYKLSDQWDITAMFHHVEPVVWNEKLGHETTSDQEWTKLNGHPDYDKLDVKIRYCQSSWCASANFENIIEDVADATYDRYWDQAAYLSFELSY